jgi:two-component system, sensor histidine kinase
MDASRTQSVSLEGVKILVAEDNYVNVLVIEGMLEDSKAEITTTENGKEVVEAIRERMAGDDDVPFDVVLMDIQMPVIDGENATRIIRAMDGAVSKIPIIALTAHAMVGDRERYLQCGMDAYLSKPVNKATLLEMIQSVLKKEN